MARKRKATTCDEMSDLLTTMPVHIQGLLAALDEGDDTAIPYLADAMEEVGDERAAGLRVVPMVHPSGGWLPRRVPLIDDKSGWQWEPNPGNGPRMPHHLRRGLYNRLPPRNVVGRHRAPSMIYPTRSAALLALAAALVAN